MPTDPSHGAGAPGTKIKVTPEMIEAGLNAYYSFTSEELLEEGEKVVTEILRRSLLSRSASLAED